MIPRLFEAASLILMTPIPKPVRSGHSYRIIFVRRPATAQAFADRMVFPGGTVDSSDNQVIIRPDKNDDIRFRVCAVRELFEETGIALAEGMKTIPPSDLHAWRKDVLNDASSFTRLMSKYNFEPAVASLAPYSNWITPAAAQHRFNTWFFITSQEECDEGTIFSEDAEIVDLKWWTPDEAIKAYRRGSIQLAPPQLYILQQLSTLRTIDEVWSNLPRIRSSAPMFPIIRRKSDSTTEFLLPGDKDYETETKAGKEVLHRVVVDKDPKLTTVYIPE